jgi:hypothetical protein
MPGSSQLRHQVETPVPEHNAVADSRAETAAYIADLSGNLARMAREHRLDALAYILEMAQLEAKSTAHRSKGEN